MKYPLSLRVLHWLMAILILGLIGVGFYMANLPGDAPDKYALYGPHKALGFIVLLLVVIRIAVRLASKLPRPCPGLHRREVKLAHSVHLVLYAAMLVMALSGFLMSSASPKSAGLDLFGLVTIPSIIEKNAEWATFFHTVHGYAAIVLCAVLALHLIGFIKHQLIEKPRKNLLNRML